MRIVKFNESTKEKFYVNDIKDYFLDLIESNQIEEFRMSLERNIMNTNIEDVKGVQLTYQISIKSDKWLDLTQYNETNAYKMIKKMDGLRNIISDLKIYPHGNDLRVYTIVRNIEIPNYLSYMNNLASKFKPYTIAMSVFLDRINIQLSEDQWEGFKHVLEESDILDNFEETKQSPFFNKPNTTTRVKTLRYSIDSNLYEDPLELILSMG